MIFDLKPAEVLKDRSDVIKRGGSGDNANSRVLNHVDGNMLT